MNTNEVPSIAIDGDLCRRDGLCVRLCPMGIFTAKTGHIPEISRTNECILCGHCVAGCPAGAIVHGGPGFDGSLGVARAGQVSQAQAVALLTERRSVRNYQAGSPPRALLEEIIRVAGHAPGSPHHRLGWVRGFTVVVGQDKMKRVRQIAAEYVRRICKLLDSLMFRCLARFSQAARGGREVLPDLRMRMAEWDNGRDLLTYQAPAAIFAHAPVLSPLPQVDCDAAMMLVLLNAHAHGLGTCWNGILQDAARGNHLRGFADLRDLLGIPEGHACYAAATIGYPQVALSKLPPRQVAVSFVE
jgi:NAD-dependent dihydropyrimidine dehydrogenase PreA subunit/nitroreductase